MKDEAIGTFALVVQGIINLPIFTNGNLVALVDIGESSWRTGTCVNCRIPHSAICAGNLRGETGSLVPNFIIWADARFGGVVPDSSIDTRVGNTIMSIVYGANGAHTRPNVLDPDLSSSALLDNFADILHRIPDSPTRAHASQGWLIPNLTV